MSDHIVDIIDVHVACTVSVYRIYMCLSARDGGCTCWSRGRAKTREITHVKTGTNPASFTLMFSATRPLLDAATNLRK